ncbi:MAG: PfkB family carbohydrate kinase, partial [Thaumarchaeota archaeon]|nr:PfkB family carbohydrate kinase [Nitrososphaerota archaeon]
KVNADCFLVSPICGEISADTFSKIKADSKFILTDPQGFLRDVEAQKTITLRKTDVDLSGIDAVKVNYDEGVSLTGTSGDDMMKSLQGRGIKYVIFTDKTNVSMLVKDKIYSITLPNKEIYDTTGIGDIFCATFCCTMLKERDFLWALCFAGGAAQAALNSKQVGLQKIPRKGEVETNASYFYNLVKFRTI